MGVTKIDFEIKKICFRDEKTKYTIVNTKIKDSDTAINKEEIIVKGFFPNLFPGDKFSAIGEIKIDNYSGEYISLLKVPELILPENKKSLIDFISKRVRGLSKKKTTEIVDLLGLNVLSIIEESHTPLLNVDKITEKKAISIRNQLICHRSFEDLSLFIQSLSLPLKYAESIYSTYKDDSLEILKSNPYSACYNNTIPFKIADTIGAYLNYNGADEKRLMVGILDYLNYKKESNGDLYTDKKDIIDNLKDYLNVYGKITVDSIDEFKIEMIIKKLINKKSIVVEKGSKNEDLIYLSYDNFIEDRIVEKLTNIIESKKTPFCLKEQIDEYVEIYEKKYFKLAKEQKESIYMCLLNNISILTGGPGTGKTNTTSAIVKCIKHIKPCAEIILLAPTGRASQRISELTMLNASTIHRGLSIKPFSGNEEIEELNSDYIIVDESSMIDVYLFDKLISSVGEDTRILFVGDVNQLPSVGPGSIFKDLIDSNVIPITILTKIFRQAEKSTIVSNSHKIIKNLKTINKNGFDISNKKENNFKFWEETNILKIKEKIDKSIDKLINTYGYKFEEIMILSPMRKNDLGTKELNRFIQGKYNPQSTTKSEYEIDILNCFREGDRVIQNVNNYDLNVFNGDIGYINKIYSIVEDGVEVSKMEVEFNSKVVVYDEKSFEELELAYAITTHKSQGSEFKVVLNPIHPIYQRMLNRSILYTGLTRAKEMFIMIGDIYTLNTAIETVSGINRNSLLKQKLMDNVSKKKEVKCS